MHGGGTGLAQLVLQAQVEIRRVDAHEHRRRLGQQAPLDVAVGRQQAGNPLERIDVAEHRERMHGVPGLEAARRHLGPAYAGAVHAGCPGLQAGDDAPGQQVARRLAGDHAYAQAHGRMMPRVEASRKSSMVCRCSATSGSACWRARSSARPSSSDSPRR
ncbi:Uncharacterised protein [Bordetella pertussis]|nr:Uncharacterised protein [Bordetella pertussis]